MNQGGRFETDATSFSPVHSENGLTVKRELIFSSIGQNEIVDKMVGLSVIMSRPHKWVKHRIEFSILKKNTKNKNVPLFSGKIPVKHGVFHGHGKQKRFFH